MSWELKGQVLAEGVPTTGARVHAAQYLPGIAVRGLPGVRTSDFSLSTVCDTEGRFHFVGLRPGPASVRVHLSGFIGGHAFVEGPGATPLVIQLERGASIRGRLEGFAVKRPVSVLLEADQRGMWESGCAGTAEFEFDGLPPGLYRIRLESEEVELVEPGEILLEPKRAHNLVLKVRSR
ncbi:MAG TPA: hypothetical protein VF950_17600 [Planctomycetota bacterium]